MSDKGLRELEQLNARVQAAREQGWTAKAIADTIGCSEAHLSRVLREPKYLTGSVVRRLRVWLEADAPLANDEEQAIREIADVVRQFEPALRRQTLTYRQKLELLDTNLRVLAQVVERLLDEDSLE